MKFSVLAAAIGATLLVGTSISQAAVYSYTGGTYSQNFDSLASSGSGLTWASNPNVAGWEAYKGSTPTPYSASTGSGNTGGIYSFGAAGSGERALGGIGSGSFTGYLAFGIQNNSGLGFGGLTVLYSGEQWRDGGGTTIGPQTMKFDYGFGATFNEVAGWVQPGGSFNWSSPVYVNTGGGAAVDGNVAGRVGGVGGTLNLAWDPGQTLWLRWIEENNAGNDHGLAIDNFTLAAVPEPAHYGLMCAVGLIGVVILRSRFAGAKR